MRSTPTIEERDIEVIQLFQRIAAASVASVRTVALSLPPLLPSGQTPTSTGTNRIEIDCECRVRGPRKSVESDSTPSWKTSTFFVMACRPLLSVFLPQIGSLPEIAPTPFMKPRLSGPIKEPDSRCSQSATKRSRVGSGCASSVPRSRHLL
jgi:hypothetical protein